MNLSPIIFVLVAFLIPLNGASLIRAAFDLGSGSFKLLVAEVREGALE